MGPCIECRKDRVVDSLGRCHECLQVQLEDEEAEVQAMWDEAGDWEDQ